MSSSDEDIPSKKRAAVDSDSDYEDSKPAAKPSKKKAATKKMKAPPKRRKNNNQIVNNGEPLPLDALVNVMEYLHPRDLLNTASTCKWYVRRVIYFLVVLCSRLY